LMDDLINETTLQYQKLVYSLEEFFSFLFEFNDVLPGWK